jgi:hypothetical protein
VALNDKFERALSTFQRDQDAAKGVRAAGAHPILDIFPRFLVHTGTRQEITLGEAGAVVGE